MRLQNIRRDDWAEHFWTLDDGTLNDQLSTLNCDADIFLVQHTVCNTTLNRVFTDYGELCASLSVDALAGDRIKIWTLSYMAAAVDGLVPDTNNYVPLKFSDGPST